MNRKKYITLTLMLSLLCMNKAYAACTQKEINEFKKIEDEYKITYEFNKSSKDYTLTFTTPENKKYDFVMYLDKKMNCKEISNKTTECYNVASGNYDLRIVGITSTCNDELKKIDLSLSKVNKYYEDELCKGIEEFVLCQPTYDKEIDYETFKSRVNTYINTKNKQNVKPEQEEKDENKIMVYLKDNIIEIIIVLIFIALLITTIIIMLKSARKSRRLE